MEVAAEFEPFMKNGFKLLRRTKDANSIKQMWKYFDEAIEEQYGSNRRPTNAAKRIPVPTALMTKDLGNEQFDVGAEDESSSSSSSSSPAPSTSKNIVEVCSSPPPTITLEQAKADPVINIDSDSDMETDLEAYSCFVCKESFVHMGNSLVECLDCHSMYHQNCHSPPITDINLNDPRIVWYCSNCRQRDSQKAQDTRTSGKDGNKKSSSKSTSAKIEKSSTKSSQHAKASPSKSKSSSDNSSPKHFPPTSSTISAMEKRVQMMKKKAAKKSEKKK
ncbi:integrator complex subunit 12 isoform X1 [Daktulosphaira vitifoliae]|uniref:integrator complex subunit 12 isoform X1 n=1 Tax=Daktulosphaira vitifoliae TaxID=58002 RepID=UPI0021AA9A02|nr:integrator complex subunit 12 isoform X1 [Daktulosphaira vitifoliae]